MPGCSAAVLFGQVSFSMVFHLRILKMGFPRHFATPLANLHIAWT